MFLIIILAVFLLLFLTSGSSSSTVEKKECGPHVWKYKKQPGMEEIEYLQCENCNMFPGGNTEETND